MEIKAYNLCKCDRNNISDESKKMRTRIKDMEKTISEAAQKIVDLEKERLTLEHLVLQLKLKSGEGL